MIIKVKSWSRWSDRGIEFLKLLKSYIFQENYVAIILPQKKAETEILPFVRHQKIKESSVRNPYENGPC